MIPALIVGLLTAWYLGLRAGIIAAIATAAALLVALVVPGLSLAVYALVIAWCAALYFLGGKFAKSDKGGWLAAVPGQATSWAKKILGKR